VDRVFQKITKIFFVLLNEKLMEIRAKEDKIVQTSLFRFFQKPPETPMSPISVVSLSPEPEPRTWKRKMKTKSAKSTKLDIKKKRSKHKQQEECLDETQMDQKRKEINQRHNYSEKRRRECENNQINYLYVAQRLQKQKKEGKLSRNKVLEEAVITQRNFFIIFDPKRREEEKILAIKHLKQIYPNLDFSSLSLESPFTPLTPSTSLSHPSFSNSPWSFPPNVCLSPLYPSPIPSDQSSGTSFSQESKRSNETTQGIAWCSVNLSSLRIKEVDSKFVSLVSRLFESDSDPKGWLDTNKLAEQLNFDIEFTNIVADIEGVAGRKNFRKVLEGLKEKEHFSGMVALQVGILKSDEQDLVLRSAAVPTVYCSLTVFRRESVLEIGIFQSSLAIACEKVI
jgi:hypothetical protein